MARIGEFLFGSRNKLNQVSNYSPEQQQFFEQIMQMLNPQGQVGQGFGQGMSQMQQMLDPSSEAMQRFSDPYMQQFEQQTVPGLAERFAGAGAMGGGLSSSGFGQALSSAGSNLGTNLAGLKSQLQMGAAKDLMGQYNQMGQMGMNAQPFSYYEQPGSMGMLPMMAAGYAGGGFPGAGAGLSSMWDMMTGGGAGGQRNPIGASGVAGAAGRMGGR